MKIKTDKIPNFRSREIGKAALALTETVFAIPGERERFEEWLKTRKGD